MMKPLRHGSLFSGIGAAEIAAEYVADMEVTTGFVLGGTGALADESVTGVFALESADEIVLK